MPIGPWVMLLGFLGVFYTMFRWWRDVLRNRPAATTSDVVSKGLRVGMVLFIVSEVFFFFAFFWAFFWGALYPPMTIATSWPPEGVEPVPTWGIPFLNTLILLLSGATVTWAHHAVKENDQQTAFKALLITVCLGLTFTGFQIFEYVEQIHEGFTLQDAIFGSAFYMATGFHGLHVQIGTIFLAVCMMRAYYAAFRPEQACRLRGGGLVLALRRRGLAVPVRLGLLVGWQPAASPPRRSAGERRRQPSPLATGLGRSLPALRARPAVPRLPDGARRAARPAASTWRRRTAVTARSRSSSSLVGLHRRRSRALIVEVKLRLAGLAAPAGLAAAVGAPLPGPDAAVQGRADRRFSTGIAVHEFDAG